MEQRACWEEGDAKPEDAPVRAGTGNGMQADRRSARRRPVTPYIPGDIDRPPTRDFIPIEAVARDPLEAMAHVPISPSAASSLTPSGVMLSGAAPAVAGSAPPVPMLGDQSESWEGRTSLFGDLER